MIEGRLAGMPCPGRISRDVMADLTAASRRGVTLIVTLTEEWAPPRDLMRRAGIESVHVPIPDMQPPTMDQALTACETVAAALDTGHCVAYHCLAGRGRTGTLLAVTLIWYEPDFDAAVQSVRAANPNWIETDAQMDFLKDFATGRKGRRQVPGQL